MAYDTCPMFGGAGGSGMMSGTWFYANIIIAAALFSVVFWGIRYLLMKKKLI